MGNKTRLEKLERVKGSPDSQFFVWYEDEPEMTFMGGERAGERIAVEDVESQFPDRQVFKVVYEDNPPLID